MEQGTDFVVSELLAELKAENKRKNIALHSVIIGAILTILVIVSGFLLYLNQYDFSGSDTTTNVANGVYTIVDSEGNTIGTDFTAEEIESFLEELNDGNG